VENLLEYLDVAEWAEILLVTFNLLNRTYEPVIAKAREKGIGTIVMNPVGGGRLVGPSDVIQRIAEEVGAVSVADLATRYVLSNPNVDTMLCGMSKPSDVDDTVASVNRGAFSGDQVEQINDFFGS
jgi:predicted aldo/keto reductase-like oxidoreductase